MYLYTVTCIAGLSHLSLLFCIGVARKSNVSGLYRRSQLLENRAVSASCCAIYKRVVGGHGYPEEFTWIISSSVGTVKEYFLSRINSTVNRMVKSFSGLRCWLKYPTLAR